MQVGRPFPFLKLPTELRLQTYRYCLVQDKPMEAYPRTDHPTGLTLSLLRTCKAMHDECAQVLYSENDFRFSERFNHLDLLGFLRHIGPDMGRWLKHLTMKVPFIDARFPVYKYSSSLSQRLRSSLASHNVHYRHICPELAQPSRYSEAYDEDKITWGCLFRSLVCTLHALPQLRELTLVLPYDFLYYHCHHYLSGNWRAALCLDTEEVWFYLEALLRAKPFLHVSDCADFGGTRRQLDKADMPHDTAKSQAVSRAARA